VVGTGHVEEHPSPSSVRGLGPTTYVHGSWGRQGPLQEPTPEADPMALGSGGAVSLLRGQARQTPCPQGWTRRSFPLGSGVAGPRPKGSSEAGPSLLGLVGVRLSLPKGRPDS
jgi:hypothetical protein